jgi:hypothetical protein
MYFLTGLVPRITTSLWSGRDRSAGTNVVRCFVVDYNKENASVFLNFSRCTYLFARILAIILICACTSIST